MKREIVLKHTFVDFIPDVLEEGAVYVSMSYATVAHRCCCGCGKEVVTPLSPTDWKLTYDGRTISLSPSIGNWGFPCQSHYWIRNGRVKWAARMSKEEIEAGRSHDRFAKETYFETDRELNVSPHRKEPVDPNPGQPGAWTKLRNWFASL
jgi:hypothetical protein